MPFWRCESGCWLVFQFSEDLIHRWDRAVNPNPAGREWAKGSIFDIGCSLQRSCESVPRDSDQLQQAAKASGATVMSDAPLSLDEIFLTRVSQ
ncbi:MAG: hypothetical protein FJ308_04655 [Planctomycetes bacterium]|nr:hypothetical protein [Planctomycetota bacterium]